MTPLPARRAHDRRGQELAASHAGQVDRDEQDWDPESSPNQRCDEADATAAKATTSMNGAALNRRFTSRMSADHGLAAAAGADEGIKATVSDQPDEPRERHHERDRRRDPPLE